MAAASSGRRRRRRNLGDCNSSNAPTRVPSLAEQRRSEALNPGRTRSAAAGCCSAGFDWSGPALHHLRHLRQVLPANDPAQQPGPPLRRRTAAPRLLQRLVGGSAPHQHLEPPVGHPLHVERGVVPYHLAETGVGRNLRVGQISLLARLEYDPGEDHGLVWPGLGQLRELHQVLHVQVVADALPVVERAVLLPDRRGLFGNAPVVLDPILPNRDDEPIDVTPHSLTLPNTNEPIDVTPHSLTLPNTNEPI